MTRLIICLDMTANKSKAKTNEVVTVLSISNSQKSNLKKATAQERKEKIPKAVREQLWLRDIGEKYSGKCKVVWCNNRVTVFDFQSGHNIPESKGGATSLENLVVICSRCNNSMSNNYTIDAWNQKFRPVRTNRFGAMWSRFVSFFRGRL